MPDTASAPDPEGLTSLEGLRRTVHADLLEYGDLLAAGYGIDVADFTGMVEAYRNLGGDLELPRRAPAPELDAAIARLAAATEDLTLEDFPPRLADVGRAVNALLTEARR